MDHGSINTISLILFMIVSSFAEIIEFGFKTGGNHCEGTSIVTLWFDYKIYQFTITPSVDYTWFLGYKDKLPMFTELGLYQCPEHNINHNPSAKLMIESNHYDALGIDDIKITTDTDWFGLDRFNINGKIESAACLDTDGSSCIDEGTGTVYKQMFHFDLTKPNQWITAEWNDAMDIDPDLEIKTCDTTQSPTFDPSMQPTMNPTFNPTLNPTFNPITFNPTFNPINDPTNDPTQELPFEISIEPVPSISDNSQHVQTSHSTQQTADDHNKDKTGNNGPTLPIIWILLVLLIMCLILALVTVIVGVAYCRGYNTHKHSVKQMGSIQSGDVGTVSIVPVNNHSSDPQQNKIRIDKNVPQNEELWNRGPITPDAATTVGNSAEDAEGTGICSDCGLRKMGANDKRSALFYCYDCAAYLNDRHDNRDKKCVTSGNECKVKGDNKIELTIN